jgi:PAS domain S-box-containing protein
MLELAMAPKNKRAPTGRDSVLAPHRHKTVNELDLYKLLVDSVEEYAIFLLDTTGHVVSWNAGAQRLKGYKAGEIIGQHFSIFYTEKDKKNGKPSWVLQQSLAKGRFEDEGWRVCKDGSRFWANVVMTALYDEYGVHRGFAKVTRDLTKRKEHEDALQATNEQLEHSYKELQKLNSLKDEFVSLASHQLRTPATGVKQYLALLIEGFLGPLSEQQQDMLHKAYASNDRQIEIINDLLQVAQLDADKVVLHKKVVDISEMVADVIDEQIDSFKLRNQRVVFQNPAEACEAAVDPVRFRMVLENLIDNASKYTPDKGTITANIKKTAKNLIVTIADTGVGIEETDLTKLFQKFSRLSNPHTKNVTGSGLGLYWAFKMVELHHGKLAVKSAIGKGTTFSITIPLKEAHAKRSTG